MEQSTIYLNFRKNVIKYPKDIALAYIENTKYKKICYEELNSYILKLVNYFSKLGIRREDKIAIFSENRWEWPVVDLACNYLGLILVPIHTTYGPKYIEYIISQTQPKTIFLSNQALFERFKSVGDDFVNKFQNIVSFEDIGSSIKQFQDILKDFNIENLPSPSEDINAEMTIIYTSGTTGMPKGAILTNGNIISNIENVLQYVPIYQTDRFFSFLPLSHVLERTAGQIVPLTLGASIYYSRNSKTIVEDIKLAKPTIFICVPRIFERIFDKIQNNLREGSKLKKKLFYYAIKTKSRVTSAKRKNERSDFFTLILCAILDKIVFTKIRKIFGGRLRIAISGGSSLNKKIARFFEDVGVKVIEGYGLTETSPIISVNKINQYKFGTVGFVLPNLEIKINPDKEILVRGSSIMKGYFNNEEESRKAIDENNWFHTGDLGFVDNEGFLNIIGRSKELIVLSTGKKVLPGSLEEALNFDKYIGQSIVIGNNQKFLIALIVPEFEEIEKYCKENDIGIDDKKSYLNLDRVQIFYKNKINECLKNFSDCEQIVSFYLVPRQFSEEYDELTPTLKLKREKIKENFNNIIKEFYN